MENAILLGTGALTWDGSERRSDRYGIITLHNENSNDEQIADNCKFYSEAINAEDGKKGKLLAEIIETRQSSHIGDFFRGIYPSTPTVGEIIVLGEGKLFNCKYKWTDTAIGLLPDDGRDSDWLNPESLYRCHEQTINLYFIPA